MRSRSLGLLLLSVLIVPNLGCQSWRYTRDCFYFCEPVDEMMRSYNCNRAAKAAWTAREHHHCGRARSDHFGLGFREGYAAVAMGGTGCPPPLPHRRYWGWRYQNCEGQECVAAWFDGYPAGARAAEEDGAANWSRMQTSYLIDAQYASRMPGSQRAGAPVAGGLFPGEELEEIPVAPVATPLGDASRVVPPTESSESVGTPLQGTPDSEPTPSGGPNEDLGSSLRKLGVPPIVRKRAEPATAAQPQPEDSEPIASDIKRIDDAEDKSVVVRKLDMPAAETLSGLSVPKKQTVALEAAPETDLDVETPELSDEAALAELQPATVAAPALAPIQSRSVSIVAETPAYSLSDENSAAATVPTSSEASVPPTKRRPPIVPAQSKKQAAPIVRPVERGRMASTESVTPTKKVSFESQSDSEAPALRRIDLNK